MKKYYLHNGTEQSGPFDLDELKSKKITKETPIWYEGLAEWTTAGKVEELKSLFVATPPPLIKPKANPVSATIPPQKKKSKVVLYVVLGIVVTIFVAGLLIAGYILDHQRPSYDSYETKVMSVEQMELAEPTKFLEATGNYNFNFWGDKIKVHGKVINSATVASFKDAVVRVIYYSKTKTELGSKEYTIYELFTPNSTKNFELKIDNYADVNSIGWEVISATPIY